MQNYGHFKVRPKYHVLDFFSFNYFGLGATCSGRDFESQGNGLESTELQTLRISQVLARNV